MSSELKKTDVNHTLGVKHSKHQPKWQHKVNPFCKPSQVKAHVFPTTSAGLFQANALGPRFRGLPPLRPQLCLVQATLMGQLCLLQATLCLQQAALKLQALQGSNSEVVPSAGKLRTHVGACEIRLKLILLHAAQINKTQNNGQVVGKVTTLRYPHGNLHLHASTIIINHLHTIYNHLKAPQCQCSATSQFLANQFASRVVRFHT